MKYWVVIVAALVLTVIVAVIFPWTAVCVGFLCGMAYSEAFDRWAQRDYTRRG